jgi:hypothetical protein
MSELSALPVRGESFILKRRNHRILVDGGYEAPELVTAFNTLGIDYVDIVVCTHADSDHAAGLKTLLNDWPPPPGQRRVGQFWLPGRWVDIVPQLLRDPRGVVDGLVRELDQLAAADPDLFHASADSEKGKEELQARLDDLAEEQRGAVADAAPEASSDGEPEIDEADQLGPERTAEPRDDWFEGLLSPEQIAGDGDGLEPPGEPGWFRELRAERDALLEKRGEGADAYTSARRRIHSRRKRNLIGQTQATYWLGLIDTVEIIREIAAQAIEHHVPVRWFDFDEFARTRRPLGGIRELLVPINSVEQVRAPRLDLTYLARLTQVNRASLVFLALPEDDALGVLFCGDSPLGDGRGYANSFFDALRPPPYPIVATAPHHGSESNRIAYSHAEDWAYVAVWLRTGGTISQPGDKFKAIQFPHRLCSYCPQAGLNRQLATIGLWSAWWPPFGIWMNGHRCVCT